MAKSPEEIEAAMVESLPEKTGKSLDQWIALIRKSKLEKHGEIVSHLKTEHSVTHGYANLIVHRALQAQAGPAPAGDDLVTAQYSGTKAGLKPVYDAIIASVSKLGSDVEIAPKKGYVSLRRSKQFALVQPSTATRVDLGINLKGFEPTKRLEASGSFNAMVSHRVRIASVSEVDDELRGWLAKAYGAA